MTDFYTIESAGEFWSAWTGKGWTDDVLGSEVKRFESYEAAEREAKALGCEYAIVEH